MAGSFYRRPPGVAWLLSLVAIPLLLAAIGWAGSKTSDVNADAGAPSVNPAATLTATNNSGVPQPETNFAPLSIAQTGNGFTLGGELPNEQAKAALSESLRLAFGSGIQLIDNTTVKPGVNAPDFAALGSILGAAVDITDFTFDLMGDTVTLSGSAPNEGAKTEAQAAVAAAWPKMKIVNNIRVK
jgi:peptidoglycan-binding protein ArfA